MFYPFHCVEPIKSVGEPNSTSSLYHSRNDFALSLSVRRLNMFHSWSPFLTLTFPAFAAFFTSLHMCPHPNLLSFLAFPWHGKVKRKGRPFACRSNPLYLKRAERILSQFSLVSGINDYPNQSHGRKPAMAGPKCKNESFPIRPLLVMVPDISLDLQGSRCPIIMDKT